MKKKNVLKTLAGVGLACVSGLGMVGCADIEVEQSKVDSLLQKGETFVDTQNEIDYKKLAEELQSYLDSEKTLTTSEILSSMRNDFITLIKTSMSHNYTWIKDDKVTRVEFVNDGLTKVYHYTIGENDTKEHEIYREIIRTRGQDDNISLRAKTYVKDLMLYSDIEVPKGVGDVIDVIEFGSYANNYAFIDDQNQDNDLTWGSVFSNEGTDMPTYYSNAHEDLVSLFESIEGMPDHFTMGYDIVDGRIVYKMITVHYAGSNTGASLEEFTLEFTDKHFKMSGIDYDYEDAGVETYDNYLEEMTFDKENTLNFDTSGYTLIDGSYQA